jgi:hypothetical protein
LEQPHSKLIAAAARRHLAPQGFVRKGRSRIWLHDDKWYVVMVEFQPSGFSKGSYLNVGAHFLWHAGPLSFDLGGRVAGFVGFESAEQFSPQADSLASRAAAESARLRAMLTDTRAAAASLPEDADESAWAHYHRAIALGLSGDAEGARRAFLGLIETPHPVSWAVERAARCRELRDLLQDPAAFREAITQRVHEGRQALGLAAIAGQLFC